MSELKPCPFCGCEDKLIGPEYSEYENKVTFWIECERCEIIMERGAKSQVIKDWNTRTDPPKYETPEPEVAEGLDGDDYNEWLTKGEEEYDKPTKPTGGDSMIELATIIKEYKEWIDMYNSLEGFNLDEWYSQNVWDFLNAKKYLFEDPKSKYETPEDFKQRTGKDYPDDAPVWVRLDDVLVNIGEVENLWVLVTYEHYAVAYMEISKHIVIANEHGKPPADYKPNKPVCPETGTKGDK